MTRLEKARKEWREAGAALVAADANYGRAEHIRKEAGQQLSAAQKRERDAMDEVWAALKQEEGIPG